VHPVENDHRTPDPLDWMLTAERCRLVRQALGRLAKRDSEILLLKYTEGWSYHQIADHLGISHSAVEARLHRARKRLRAELLAAELTEVK
jgi:RNA polymerase sigma-70 factor (ECF subfamily)